MADKAAQSFLVGVPVRPADPSATAEAFVDALAPIVETVKIDETKRRAGAEFARERYSWESMASSLLAIFSSFKTDGVAVKTPFAT